MYLVASCSLILQEKELGASLPVMDLFFFLFYMFTFLTITIKLFPVIVLSVQSPVGWGFASEICPCPWLGGGLDDL